MWFDADKPVEACKAPAQPFDDLVARQPGIERVRAGVLVPVDRFHRHVQQELMAGPVRHLGLLRQIVGIGHERQGQRPRQPYRLGSPRPVEAEIVEHDCNQRPVAAGRRRDRKPQPRRLGLDRRRQPKRRWQRRLLDRF